MPLDQVDGYASACFYEASALRSHYWIIGLRYIAKAAKKNCMACRRVDPVACSQPAAPLPDTRVQMSPPFTVIGLDNAGPLYCSDQPGKKMYVLLITCAVIRAVHLEVVESLCHGCLYVGI